MKHFFTTALSLCTAWLFLFTLGLSELPFVGLSVAHAQDAECAELLEIAEMDCLTKKPNIIQTNCAEKDMQLDYSFTFLPSVNAQGKKNEATRQVDAWVKDILSHARQFSFVFPEQVQKTLKKNKVFFCEEAFCLREVAAVIPSTNTVLFTIEEYEGLIISITYAIYHKSGKLEQDVIPVSAFRSNYAALVTALDRMTSFLTMGETLMFPGYEPIREQMNQGLRSSEELAEELDEKLMVAKAKADAAVTETQYPIIGPAILGAAGVALTSLAIVGLADGESCAQTDSNGNCLNGKKGTNEAAIFGYGISGGAAITGAVLWFVLGAEEVPVEVQVDEQTAAIQFQGKF